MKRSINLYYADILNAGDLLNIPIIEDLFGYRVKRRTYLTGEMSAIGSGLDHFTYSDNVFIAAAQCLAGFLCPKIVIWGTGFIFNNVHDNSFFRKKVSVAAVRGELTKKRMEKILGYRLDIPLADAGILSSYLLKEKVEKKYKVGIIPHRLDYDNPIILNLKNRYSHSSIINMRDKPLSVIRKIAECECVISSSLHGLIIADSLFIPNKHMVVSSKLLGDGFKFDDYYSAYGLEHKFVDLRSAAIPEIDSIFNDYQLTTEMVDKKKREMIDAFPYPHVSQTRVF